MLALLESTIAIAREVACAIATLYNTPQQDYQVQLKGDASPVTVADKISERLLRERFTALTPEWPVLSEESQAPSFTERSQWQRYWLVDPLDGTKEFLLRSGEFTVNIALIEANLPILGVVAVPMRQTIYYALKGQQAFVIRQDAAPVPITVSPLPTPVRVTLSRRHGQGARLIKFLDALPVPHTIVPCGSTLKICLIAEGRADLYPRFGNTSEWDTAAGQCVLEAAGGGIIQVSDQLPLRYNHKPSLINPEFIACSQIDQAKNWLS